ncbi:hypothetical protein PWT90_06031 [Aphanocladium album]|nr:hypothetical protein PWT90_06031 [Aphanocladium album]
MKVQSREAIMTALDAVYAKMDLSFLSFVVVIVTALFLCQNSRWRALSLPNKPQKSSNTKDKSRFNAKLLRQTQIYKDLYFKLQNLESFPDVLPEAKRQLFLLLREGLLMAEYKSQPRSIANIEKYDAVALTDFLDDSRQDVLDNFESYIRRRQNGTGTELFSTREEAVEWLKSCAPLNFVDGAWLAHLHKITTPFTLRGLTKDAWQTYSEELGDGDLDKNHVLIYRNLLRDVGVLLPDCDAVEFIHLRHGLDREQIWRNAVGHLLISLFPNEFLPEILGMNLHFESLSLNMLKTNKELPEFGISAYYFALHISIDNADSGHSAMALATVMRFMDHVRKTGSMDCDLAWKRIQAGYLLSQSLEDDETVADYEGKLGSMMFQKGYSAGQVHCTSRVKIGRRTLMDWLSSTRDSSDADDHDKWKSEFLTALADSRPWVCRGNSNKSLLMRELRWKGRMFGAFTNVEVERLRIWIDSLGERDSNPASDYWRLIGTEGSVPNSLSPLRERSSLPLSALPRPRDWLHGDVVEFDPRLPLAITELRLEALLPLWFVHPAILDNIVRSPYRTATGLISQVLMIVRAEMGYQWESDIVDGMDVQLFPIYCPDLVDMGLQIMRRYKLPEPTCIEAALEGDNDAVMFAHDILAWAERPVQNCGQLLGLSRAFLDLEIWMAGRDDLLWNDAKQVLLQVADRKGKIFDVCLGEIKGDKEMYRAFINGYETGRDRIERLLE